MDRRAYLKAIWARYNSALRTAKKPILDEFCAVCDCDNGSEFLNHHLVRYFTDRKAPTGLTRSRPYKKNDNAHVEQQN